MFKGVDFYPHGASPPLMAVRHYFIAASCVAAMFALALILAKGLNFGIDFKGGALFEVQGKVAEIDIGELRSNLSGLDLGEVQIQSLDDPRDALIRVEQQQGGETAQQEAADTVRIALGDDIEIGRVEGVGPAVSGELKQAGMIAISLSMVGILLYIWFRFEWQFGIAAILALFHDIFITIGMFSLLGFTFGLAELAALLTLAGYSINDTVVVFDRIRENLRRFKKMPMVKLLDVSISETLSRTVITSGTTFAAVAALYVFGTEVIRGFAFAMLFGILIGTWSSIFVASPFLLWIGVRRDWSEPAATEKPTTPARE